MLLLKLLLLSRYTKKSNLPENFTIIEGQKKKTIHIDSNNVLAICTRASFCNYYQNPLCFSFEIIKLKKKKKKNIKYGNPSEVSITKAIISQESKTLKDSESST